MSTNSLMIRAFPQDERPRERFIQNGPESLSNHELIAILLRTGTKDESVLQLSNRLLTHFEGLRLLKAATLEEITESKGLVQLRLFKFSLPSKLAEELPTSATMIGM